MTEWTTLTLAPLLQPSVNDDIKQAAAEVLRCVTQSSAGCAGSSHEWTVSFVRVVSLEEFDKPEIRRVVDMLASVPALASPKTYDILTNFLYLMFKMALVGHITCAHPCIAHCALIHCSTTVHPTTTLVQWTIATTAAQRSGKFTPPKW